MIKRQLKTSGSFAQRIRDDAAFVMSQAQSVFIHQSKVTEYARRVIAEMPRVSTLDTDNHLVIANSPATTMAYVLALDSINFGSGVFIPAQKAGLELEYSVVAKALKAKMAKGEWTDITSWKSISATDCHEVFQLYAGKSPEVDWLMTEFSRHLQMTAACVEKDFRSADGILITDGQALLEIVSKWPHFRDETTYQDKQVGIFKRAQILVADLALALPDKKFTGVDLTCFADNMVPHVLRTDGIITYSQALAERIDAGLEIQSGSPEEVELRCAAIHTVSLMQQALADDNITDVNLDHMLWHRGYLPGFSGFRPHRTITTNY